MFQPPFQPLLLSTLLLVQARAQPQPAQGDAGRQNPTSLAGPALAWRNGVLHGAGPSYQAHFSANGFEFRCVLAPDSPGIAPLRLCLTSVHRDAASLPLPSAELVAHGHTAEYVRPHLVERYELLDDGIEQSFVLEGLPHENATRSSRDKASKLRVGVGAASGPWRVRGRDRPEGSGSDPGP